MNEQSYTAFTITYDITKSHYKTMIKTNIQKKINVRKFHGSLKNFDKSLSAVLYI